MEKFNFNDVEIFWINCSKNTKRSKHMTEILNKHFPNNKKHHVEAIMETPKYNGVTMAHAVALMKGLNSKKPFIILEDDVTIDATKLDIKRLEFYLNKMEKLPDVVYMGLSSWGKNAHEFKKICENDKVVRWNNWLLFDRGAKAKEVNNEYFIRIIDMFSAHAILYLSSEYVIYSIECCVKGIEINRPHDIILPLFMRKKRVIGLKEPWFYQIEELGGQESATRLSLKDVNELRL